VLVEAGSRRFASTLQSAQDGVLFSEANPASRAGPRFAFSAEITAFSSEKGIVSSRRSCVLSPVFSKRLFHISGVSWLYPKGRRVGRPVMVDAAKLQWAAHLRESGHTIAEIVEKTGIARTSLYGVQPRYARNRQ
jgi:hypothetical protein